MNGIEQTLDLGTVIAAIISVIAAGVSARQAYLAIKYQSRISFYERKIEKLCKFFEKDFIIMHSTSYPPSLEDTESYDSNELKNDAKEKFQTAALYIRDFYHFKHLLSSQRQGVVESKIDAVIEDRRKSKEISFTDERYRQIITVMNQLIFELTQAVLEELRETSNLMIKQ